MNGNWIHDLLVHKKEKTTVLQVDWVLVLITGLSKSSDLGILLQKHLNIGPTSLGTFKKIWVKKFRNIPLATWS